MKIELEIKKVVIVMGNSPDYVFLHTNKPMGIWSYSEDSLSMKFEVVSGNGKEFTMETFRISEDIIEVVILDGIEQNILINKHRRL